MRRLFPENNFVAPFLVEGTRIAVAEAPGQVEAERGEPLCGPSGSWLRGREDDGGKRSGGLYRAAGINEGEVSRLNVINCQPPGNIFPTDPGASYISAADAEVAVAHCLGAHVLPVLRTPNRWSRVDIFGDKALRALCQVGGGILRWRGSPLPIPALGPEPRAVPTIHPAYLARTQELIPAVVCDLRKSLHIPEEHYNLSPTLDEVRNFTATEFAFDIETIRGTGEITMVGLSANPTTAIVVPCTGAYIPELRRIFENATVLYTQNGIAFDIPRLFPVLGLEWKPSYPSSM